ncbi:hypothetical protein EDB83DRAFT_2320031 [Lactarius deliciosus]|nr:hypothetical protein EDB83DRAFT_2320031 [Lactarius deliciosus]
MAVILSWLTQCQWGASGGLLSSCGSGWPLAGAVVVQAYTKVIVMDLWSWYVVDGVSNSIRTMPPNDVELPMPVLHMRTGLQAGPSHMNLHDTTTSNSKTGDACRHDHRVMPATASRQRQRPRQRCLRRRDYDVNRAMPIDHSNTIPIDHDNWATRVTSTDDDTNTGDRDDI